MNQRGTEVTEGRAIQENRTSEAVIGAAIEVHKVLGPGLLESAYETCHCRELGLRGIVYERQRPLPVASRHAS